MSWLKRGELAKATGTNIETIRYYENKGLIPEAERNEKVNSGSASCCRRFGRRDIQPGDTGRLSGS